MNDSRKMEKLDYLDPVILSSIGSLELVARRVVDGFISGLHKSPDRGFNIEFTEHRPYSPGDEIRHIDWRAYARVDRFLIKQFEEETNLRATLLLDRSESMNYGGPGRLSKMDYAKVLCACLSYLMLRQRDSVGLMTFSDRIDQFVPPRSKISHLESITECLKNCGWGKDTSLEPVLSGLAERLRRRGLVIVVSDLIDDPAALLKGIRHLRHLRHEVVLFQILDPDEIELPFRGLVKFEDPENASHLTLDPGRVMEEYQARIREFIDVFHNGATEIGVDHLLLKTTDPLQKALASYLENRKRSQSGSRSSPVLQSR